MQVNWSNSWRGSGSESGDGSVTGAGTWHLRSAEPAGADPAVLGGGRDRALSDRGRISYQGYRWRVRLVMQRHQVPRSGSTPSWPAHDSGRGGVQRPAPLARSPLPPPRGHRPTRQTQRCVGATGCLERFMHRLGLKRDAAGRQIGSPRVAAIDQLLGWQQINLKEIGLNRDHGC